MKMDCRELNLERAVVFIDGNNLYHRLKERGWKTWINIGVLAKRIVGKRQLVKIYYYNAPPPGGKPFTKKGNAYFSEVKRTKDLVFRQSWLQHIKRTDENGEYNSYREKGGDTALTTDLIASAAANEYDVAVIVSSDGDYAPAAHVVSDEYKKNVEVIYFEGSRPFSMQSCSLMRAFRRGFVEEYDVKKRRSTREQSKKHRIR